MTEDEARDWLTSNFSATQVAMLERFAAMVVAENERQNLIAPSTVASIWNRHIVDSAQLVAWRGNAGRWLDVGTGGGFPGVVVAVLTDMPVAMVEPRKRRVAFLEHCIDALELGTCAFVAGCKVEQLDDRYDIVSARAVAQVDALLHATQNVAGPNTRWLLPRGRLSSEERIAFEGRRDRMFHVEQSLTDPTSSILIVDATR